MIKKKAIQFLQTIINLSLNSFILMLIWNLLLTSIFGFQQISFLQAVILYWFTIFLRAGKFVEIQIDNDLELEIDKNKNETRE